MEGLIKNNKLIADFIGASKTSNCKDNEMFISGQTICRIDTIELGKGHILKFHKSWDWLMPVVEKIEKIYETETSLPRFEINSHYVKFFIMDYNTGLSYVSISGCYLKSPEAIKFKTKIEAVYNEVVEFINWHNKIEDESS